MAKPSTHDVSIQLENPTLVPLELVVAALKTLGDAFERGMGTAQGPLVAHELGFIEGLRYAEAAIATARFGAE